MEPSVGIDLGTTHSVVAHLDSSGRPWTIQNSEGDTTTPSAVFFDRRSIVVGKEALKVAEHEPERIAQFAKRDIGSRAFHNSICGTTYPPEVIEALVLQKIRDDAQRKLGNVRKAVVTVPAYFNEPRRKATQDAGRMAGLDVLDIINEPTAAAIAYGVQQGFLDEAGESRMQETVLVYDLGGGTFDVTLMQIDGRNYNAVATAGDVYLGGIDWDARIAEFVAAQFQEEFGIDPRTDACANQRLLAEAEEVKRSLSAREEVTIHFAHEGNRTRADLTRAKFQELTGDLLDRPLFTTRKVLSGGGKSWQDVTRLLLVGGSSRMPMVGEMLAQESGFAVDRSLSPDESVAHGAAIYAGFLLADDSGEKHSVSVQDVNSHDLGVLGVDRTTGTNRRRIMIARNTALPALEQKRFTTLKAGQPNVVVNVVEGGDDSGNDATAIGTCRVTGLPVDLPAESIIEVTFKYETNGRLTVAACLPEVKQQASMVIERASGLTDEEIETWAQRICNGLMDSTEPPQVADKQIPLEFAERETSEQCSSQASEEDGDGVQRKAGGTAPTEAVAESKAGGWKSRRVRVSAGDEDAN